MIKKIVIMLIVLMIFVTGCSSKIELEDRDFCMAIGIDLSVNELCISYAFPNLSEITGQKEGQENEHLYDVKVKSLYDSERMYAYTSNKKLDFSHLKVIIIGENIASDEDKMKELLKYLEDNSKYSKNTLVFIANDTAKSIIELQANVKGSIGNYLSELYTNNVKNNSKEKATLGDLINNMNNTEEILGIPVIETEKELPVIKGAGIFKNNKLLGYVNNAYYTYLIMAKGDGKGNNIYIDDNCTIKIENVKRKYSISKIKETPNLLLEIKGNAVVVDGTAYKEMDNSELRDKVNKTIAGNIEYALKKILTEYKGDYLNSYKLAGVKNRGLWLSYKDRENEFYEDLSVKVVVELDVR